METLNGRVSKSERLERIIQTEDNLNRGKIFFSRPVTDYEGNWYGGFVPLNLGYDVPMGEDIIHVDDYIWLLSCEGRVE